MDFKQSVDHVFRKTLEKQASVPSLAKTTLTGMGATAVPGAILGALSADEGHRGAGALTGATMGGLLGAGVGAFAHKHPLFTHQLELERIATQAANKMKEMKFQSGLRQAENKAGQAANVVMNRIKTLQDNIQNMEMNLAKGMEETAIPKVKEMLGAAKRELSELQSQAVM